MKENLAITILLFILNVLFYFTGGASGAFSVSTLFGVAMCVLLLVPLGSYVYFTIKSRSK